MGERLFWAKREGIGSWSDRVRDSGCGVCGGHLLEFGVEYRRVSFDVLRLKRYMTSDSEMIGMDDRGSDGSYLSSSPSSSSSTLRPRKMNP